MSGIFCAPHIGTNPSVRACVGKAGHSTGETPSLPRGTLSGFQHVSGNGAGFASVQRVPQPLVRRIFCFKRNSGYSNRKLGRRKYLWFLFQGHSKGACCGGIHLHGFWAWQSRRSKRLFPKRLSRNASANRTRTDYLLQYPISWNGRQHHFCRLWTFFLEILKP